MWANIRAAASTEINIFVWERVCACVSECVCVCVCYTREWKWVYNNTIYLLCPPTGTCILTASINGRYSVIFPYLNDNADSILSIILYAVLWLYKHTHTHTQTKCVTGWPLKDHKKVALCVCNVWMCVCTAEIYVSTRPLPLSFSV